VTLVADGNYRNLAEKFGFEFREFATARKADELFSDPNFWHPIKGPAVGAKWGIHKIPAQYKIFADLANDGDTIFIASPAVFGARLAHETHSRPIVSLVLQPWMIASSIAPPTMPAKLTLPRWAPGFVKSTYWEMIEGVGYLLVGRHLNRFRKQLGLPPVLRVFRWWLSPKCIIGCFPDWYGQPQKDWSPLIKLAGFPMFDPHSAADLPDDLLTFIRAGDPPIVFTFGTGMMHAAHLFASAMKACRHLNRRAIFVTRFAEQLPKPLPAHVHHCPAAPFAKLFPKCAAVVHHGGVGTLSQAIAAGIPQLILPIAYDQLDNALRVKGLGAGDYLPHRRRNPEQIAQAMKEILRDPIQSHCKELAVTFPNTPGSEIAADIVEQLALSSRASR
jgi:UDP:flavonoid glycosyltransferase YjiC (YdhE family)